MSARTLRMLRALGPIDARSVLRDSFMRWFLLLPFAFALLLRWLMPMVSDALMQRFEFDLQPYVPLVAGFMTMVTPGIAGSVIGFLLLDQKDDGTLVALRVTPMSLSGFLVYRLAVPTLLSIVLTYTSMRLMNLTEIGRAELLIVSLLASPMAPMYALFLPAFANNKVQGFALMKAAGIINWPALIAWFVPETWKWSLGIVPTVWPARAFWLATTPPLTPTFWWVVVVGLAWQIVLIWLLYRRFRYVLSR